MRFARALRLLPRRLGSTSAHHDGRGGSTFTPYSDTSSSYDETRRPLGVPCILGAFATSPWPLHEQHLLDVGGGTGTFVNLVGPKFGTTTLLEYDAGMLGKAQHRLLGTSVRCVQGSADDLSQFSANAFQAVSINQVVHHFPPQDGFAFFKKAIHEIHRVVAPGGALVLNTSSATQFQDGFWWYHLMPRSTAAFIENTPSVEQSVAAMREAGFQVLEEEIFTPLDGTLMSSQTYFTGGLDSAFSKEFRDGDSAFSMAEKLGELDQVFETIKQIQKDGKEEEWIMERELARKRVGQATFITARKPQ